jgi:hypothetical protein
MWWIIFYILETAAIPYLWIESGCTLRKVRLANNFLRKLPQSKQQRELVMAIFLDKMGLLKGKDFASKWKITTAALRPSHITASISLGAWWLFIFYSQLATLRK